ncbi:MAG TPA: hypothetical protein VGN89_08600 [Phenylobacterium sp.]|nr:hypothetical protein [Phenylobacterium sp.]
MERDLSTPAIADEVQSAVSWPAILAGAVAALAISLVLMGLAAGFGLKLASPWPGAHPSLSGFTPILGAWMMGVQVLSSALGGYLAGRLRTKWLNVHTHEVHFRDTAHGFLVWALSTVAGVLLVATLLAPPPEAVTAVAVVDPALLQVAAERQANIAAQFSLFMSVGLLLGAFVASVAAAIGGLRRDEMHTAFWDRHGRLEPGRP